MIKYSSQPPFCVSYPPRISNDVVVPIHVYHAYDAVMIYAQALTEALREGYDPRNGTNVMERIRNRRYRSVLGYDVSQTLSFHIQDFPMLKSLLFLFSIARYLLTRTATLKAITRSFPCCLFTETIQHRMKRRITSCNLLGISSTTSALILRTILS